MPEVNIDQDKQALDWVSQNPKDEDAQAVMKKLGVDNHDIEAYKFIKSNPDHEDSPLIAGKIYDKIISAKNIPQESAASKAVDFVKNIGVPIDKLQDFGTGVEHGNILTPVGQKAISAIEATGLKARDYVTGENGAKSFTDYMKERMGQRQGLLSKEYDEASKRSPLITQIGNVIGAGGSAAALPVGPKAAEGAGLLAKGLAAAGRVVTGAGESAALEGLASKEPFDLSKAKEGGAIAGGIGLALESNPGIGAATKAASKFVNKNTLALIGEHLGGGYGGMAAGYGVGTAIDKLAPMITKKVMQTAEKVKSFGKEALGDFAPILEGASKSGNKALALTHIFLSQNDPSYNDMIVKNLQIAGNATKNLFGFGDRGLNMPNQGLSIPGR